MFFFFFLQSGWQKVLREIQSWSSGFFTVLAKCICLKKEKPMQSDDFA